MILMKAITVDACRFVARELISAERASVVSLLLGSVQVSLHIRGWWSAGGCYGRWWSKLLDVFRPSTQIID